MKTFHEALGDEFTLTDDGYWSYRFGPQGAYELAFEPLLCDRQHYVALYQHDPSGDPLLTVTLTEKVPIKPGKVEKRDSVELLWDQWSMQLTRDEAEWMHAMLGAWLRGEQEAGNQESTP